MKFEEKVTKMKILTLFLLVISKIGFCTDFAEFENDFEMFEGIDELAEAQVMVLFFVGPVLSSPKTF